MRFGYNGSGLKQPLRSGRVSGVHLLLPMCRRGTNCHAGGRGLVLPPRPLLARHRRIDTIDRTTKQPRHGMRWAYKDELRERRPCTAWPDHEPPLSKRRSDAGIGGLQPESVSWPSDSLTPRLPADCSDDRDTT